MRTLSILLTFLFLTSGCSNMINKMHREFDQDLGVAQPYQPQRNKFDMYRQNNRNNPNARTAVNSRTTPNIRPVVQRNYVPQNQVRKRVTADDLNDNSNGGSLWTQNEQGHHPHLFTDNNKKRNGDIVLIKVSGKLKNEITAELKRAFPDPIVKGKKPAEEENVTKVGEVQDDKVYDRISSVVIEEINRDHLLLRGRKNLLYKNKKRLIEVQALVTRTDIGIDNTLHSNKIIESAITVLR